MRQWLAYTLAVLGYIGLAMLTKRFLTWTWGPVYYLTVLEAAPRCYRRLRRLPTASWRFGRRRVEVEAVAET